MPEPVLLLHGALGSKTQLEPLKHLLEANNRKVYSMNFSGHCGSPFSPQGFGIAVFASDVSRFITEMNIGNCDIFGYSMGGYVALWLAHLSPSVIHQVVTFGTKFDWSPESSEREIAKMDPQKIEAKIPAFARLLEHRHAPNNWKELLHKTAAMMHELGQAPLLTPPIFSTIDHKCKILLGDQDDMADRSYSEKVAGWLPHGEFHLLENTSHPIEKLNLDLLMNWL